MQNKSQPTTQTQNQNTPKIRFKNFSDEWVDSKLGEICKITMGQSPNGATYSEIPSDYILVQGNADLKNGFVYPRIYTTQKTKMAYIGDLIMSVRAPAGAMGKTLYNVVLGRGVAGIKGNEFIYQNLIKFDMEGYWSSFSAGSTFESLNSNVIFNAKISIPNSEEQEKIGAFFSKLDKLISLHQSKFEKLQKIKKSCLQNLFPQNNQNTPKIRFKNFSDEWVESRLGEFGNILTGSTPPTNISELYDNNGIPWVTPTDITSNLISKTCKRLSKKGELVSRIVPPKTILVTCIASIGKNAMLLTRGSFNQQINSLTVNDNNDPYFMLTQSSLWSEQMKKQAAQATMQIVNKTEFSNIKAYIPNLTEQEKIGAFFSKLDKLISLQQRKVEKLKNIKKALLNKMFI